MIIQGQKIWISKHVNIDRRSSPYCDVFPFLINVITNNVVYFHVISLMISEVVTLAMKYQIKHNFYDSTVLW